MLEGKVIQGLENYSYKEITDLIKYFIIDRLYENNIIPNKDIKIIGIQLHGSRLRGQAKKRSDLDAVFQYDGNLREDDLFTLLNSRPQYRIEGIKVDINPIKEDMGSYMKRSDDYDQYKLGNKLEERINKLEKVLKVNEEYNRDELGLKAMNAVESVSNASDIISQIVISLDYENDPLMGEWKSIEDKLNDIIVKINKLGFKL